MDLVWLHGPDGRASSEELRYSIRSITQNLLGEHRVWVVGFAPAWLNLDRVHFVPVPMDGENKHDATRRGMLAACERAGFADSFLYLNDDFFALAPVAGVPVWHRGALQGSHKSTWYQAQHDAAQWLRGRGVDNPLNYELHIPLVVNRHLMGNLLTQNPKLPAKRSCYGNLAHIGGVQHEDVKARTTQDPLGPGPWVSTSDRAFEYGKAGESLRVKFPEQSVYEIGPAPGCRRPPAF